MTTGDRMKIRRKEIGLSAEQVAEALEISPATVYRYESGDIEKLPGDRLIPLARVLRTTPAYLMGWNDEPGNLPTNLLPIPKTVKKPRLGVIACGDPILTEEKFDGYDDVPAFIKCDFTLKCEGDSMINARILDGDIVYIKQQPDVDNGEIAAVCVDGAMTLKRVYKHPGQVVLQAENPKYAPYVYTGSELENIRILGKVVGFTSENI